MCGIILTVSREESFEINDETLNILKARGPDCLRTYTSKVNVDDGSIRYLTFTSSVLSLRGSQVLPQPLVDEKTSSVFCWNGEAWTFEDCPISGNDAEYVFQRLLHVTDHGSGACNDPSVRSRHVLKVLTSVAGPYAMLYFDAPASTLYYARDPLGRRSLMLDFRHKIDTSNHEPLEVVLSSFEIADQGCGTEVLASGIHSIKVSKTKLISTLITRLSSDTSINKVIPESYKHLSMHPDPASIHALRDELLASVATRVRNVPTFNTTTIEQSDPSRVAVLFSGGIDCALILRLIHEALPLSEPVDLLNVAFENPRTIRAAAVSKKASNTQHSSPYEICPDRMTGRSTFAELCATCPDRVWRFVAIDVGYPEMLEHQPMIIRLMRPHNTEMDLSIATALYFAARGKGTAFKTSSAVIDNYTTSARVLLSGLGADELFGGYSRHAAAFSRGGFEALNDELELDFTRIGTRNLGRDDRVMAHWSREVRYPFLDEKFVKFALQLPAWDKVGFRDGKKIPRHFEHDGNHEVTSMDELDPAKMILRCVMWELGMRKVSNERKRAIQFGARTAKMEGGRTKGTDVLVMA